MSNQAEHLRVIDGEPGADGDPLSDCRVTLNVEGGVSYGSFMGGHYVESSTGNDGRYAIEFVRPGRYTVSAGGAPLGGLLGQASAGGRVVRSGLVVEEGSALDSVDFRLEDPGELTGVVVALLMAYSLRQRRRFRVAWLRQWPSFSQRA